MADATGGDYVSATSEDELIKALRKTLGCPFVTEMVPAQSDRSRLAVNSACEWTPPSATR